MEASLKPPASHPCYCRNRSIYFEILGKGSLTAEVSGETRLTAARWRKEAGLLVGGENFVMLPSVSFILHLVRVLNFSLCNFGFSIEFY